MRGWSAPWGAAAVIGCLSVCANAATVGGPRLRLSDVPGDGVIAARLALPSAQDPWTPNVIAFEIGLRDAAGATRHALVVVDPSPTATKEPRQATLYAYWPGARAGTYSVTSVIPARAERLVEPRSIGSGRNALRLGGAGGGMPTALAWGSVEFSDFALNDRIHEPERGGWLLRYDREPDVMLLADTPRMAVVRTRMRYCDGEGRPAPGGARATYDWVVYKETPYIRVSSVPEQQGALVWPELHHLEFNTHSAAFTASAGGQPPMRREMKGEKATWVTPDWAALVAGRRSVAIVGREARIYDGRSDYGAYVHGEWRSWSTPTTAMSAWLRIGDDADPVAAIATEARNRSLTGRASLASSGLLDMVRVARSSKDAERAWLGSIADRLVESGRHAEAETMLQRASLPSWRLIRAGRLGLAFRAEQHGVRLYSLFDLNRRREIAAANQPPLFRLSLRTADGKEGREISSDSGWRSTTFAKASGGWALTWVGGDGEMLDRLRVRVMLAPDTGFDRVTWTIRVENPSDAWCVEQVAFPQVCVDTAAPDAVALYPTGPGVLRPVAKGASIAYHSLYPNGWCTMQFMASYSPSLKVGLYAGMHDPVASAKWIDMTHESGSPGVVMSYAVPAPDLQAPGTPFSLSGTAVWQLLRGDWYDAARIYRAWVRKSAAWFPKLTSAGRSDTPEWMRTLSAWAQTGGAPEECVSQVMAMQEALGVPIGFHWYNWHQIPFDNDYPHYFPTKPGVAEAVAKLQDRNVYVMPYINGRLWDTHDRGAEDFEFTAKALPSATKHRDGSPFIEEYGSKEADGSPVRLAVMCPTTALWRNTVRDTVLRIMREVGTAAVYIDQIGAAPPALCMDRSHGHRLGGGSWWTEGGYWPLLADLRKMMPAGKMITTECAAEAYAAWIDGFLTWDWQSDGMVPALPAVYGGAVQYFGRNYAAGATTRDLALCMKMGQQLVFGEQIGWLNPALATEPVAGRFLREVVRLRNRFVRYFCEGEMVRPPRLETPVPEVRADWAWYGETWVTTPAVLTGAWRLPGKNKIVMLFANVSDKAVSSQIQWSPRTYGVAGRATMSAAAADGTPAPARPLGSGQMLPLTLDARSAIAWEISW